MKPIQQWVLLVWWVSFALPSIGLTTTAQKSLLSDKHLSLFSTVPTPAEHYFATITSKRSDPLLLCKSRGRLSSSSSSCLFSTKDNSDGGPNRVQRFLQRFLITLKRARARVLAKRQQSSIWFAKLSKKGKIFLLIISILFGRLTSKVVHTRMQNNNTPLVTVGRAVEMPYSTFLDLTENKQSSMTLDKVKIGNDRIVYELKQESEPNKQIVAYTRKVPASTELVNHLRTNNIPFSAAPKEHGNPIAIAMRTIVFAFYMMILYRMYKTFSGNSGAGDVPGKLAGASVSSLEQARFNDIQGIDGPRDEVMELVDTLRNPDKYKLLGARAPTGLLLEGPPGTGKTMLARATAATAGVPLLYCSGSDFVEMYVGRGAARVRKLFERASKMAPCIIFVDELDALGKARDSGNLLTSRGNDEAEQTLNQLLACMDGLDSSRRICVLAATNRKDVLDPALIRPGRFDRIVRLELPDTKGRENILRVHARKLPGFEEGQGVNGQNSLGVGRQVDLSAVAAVTQGLSGAELEFIVNEAAIRAVRRVSSAIRSGDESVAPHVTAVDFEASVQNFFATRRPSGGGMNDVLKNVWKSK